MLLASFKSISVALLTSVTMPCITPPEHIHIITGSLSLLTTFTISPTPHPLPLVTTNLFSVSMENLCHYSEFLLLSARQNWRTKKLHFLQ